MRAFHAEKHSIKRDEIAARQRHTSPSTKLLGYASPRCSGR